MSVRLNDEATVYLAELNAIDLAVDHVLEHNYAKVDIITDSRSVLQALSNPIHNCPLIWRLKSRVDQSLQAYFRKDGVEFRGIFTSTQIITGHDSLADYQGKFFGKNSTCDCGQETENRSHLVYKCKLWTAHREKHFPKNFARTPLNKLLLHQGVRNGLQEILQGKLEKVVAAMQP
ncbi:hypothetical protein CDAR_57151 [Caerostris darwini]|uniref:RNase H type-1 domain-containing protein n=1 Tax=Caerostris darwini TaxID=1538125 RepID=A0AAV4WBM1_9ARAC|nr:hypothetical protein CDAR_57151 [Caerostris darwini]